MFTKKTTAVSRKPQIGEVITMEKEKPLFPVRGITKIELFNEDGELIQEVESENFISKTVTEKLLSWQKMMFMATSERTTDDSSYWQLSKEYNGPMNHFLSYGNLFGYEQNYVSNAPFRRLLLTTNDNPEVPNVERVVRGSVVGWADKSDTYSGVSTKQGTVNPNESYMTKGQMHFVFDFPTHVANGTFSSIYWAQDESQNYGHVNDYNYITLSLPQGAIWSSSVFNNNLAAYRDGYFYFMFGSATSSSTVIAKYSINIEAKTATFISSVEINLSHSIAAGFDIDPSTGDIWIMSTNANLYRYNGTTGEPYNFNEHGFGSNNWIDVEKWAGTPSGKYSTDTHLGGCLIDGNDLYVKMYVGSKSSSSPYYDLRNHYHIARFDKNTMTLLDILDERNYGSGKIYKQNGRFFSGLDEFNSAWKKDGSCALPFYSSAETNIHNGIFLNDDIGMISYLNHSDTDKFRISRHRLGCFGARNLLPSPVEKTSSSTMKITYDFIFDIPDVW